jgi:cobalt-zinc-cadmium efflux system membrane fusion protein
MRFRVLPLFVLLCIMLSACGQHEDEAAHGHAGDSHEEAPEGPNGGRLLTRDDIAVELKIVDQTNGSTRFVAWVTKAGKPLSQGVEGVTVRTERLGGEREVFDLAPRDGRFAAGMAVREPHSFVVTVATRIDGRALEWSFDSFEGRVSIDAAIAKEAGISVARLGAGSIRETVDVPGVVRPLESATAKVSARFPGVVRSVAVRPGDRVAAGSVLAVIDSNASLAAYRLTAPISGTIIHHDAAVGDAVGEQTLFEIADTGRMQVELHLFGNAAQRTRPGAKVRVQRLLDEVVADTEISRVLPDVDVRSQSVLARAAIRNDDGLWRPGSAVQAEIELSRVEVPRAMPADALQTWRNMPVAFIRVGDIYEVRPVVTGRRDSRFVEVLDGLKAGDEIVVGQSYLIKADIEKSGATHDH